MKDYCHFGEQKFLDFAARESPTFFKERMVDTSSVTQKIEIVKMAEYEANDDDYRTTESYQRVQEGLAESRIRQARSGRSYFNAVKSDNVADLIEKLRKVYRAHPSTVMNYVLAKQDEYHQELISQS